jgi:septum formation protein
VAQINAYRKARLIAKKHPDQLVLGADTVVSLGRKLFGKPGTLREAQEMLAQLQGRTHLVVTGVCLLHLREHKQRTFSVSTAVTFRTLHAEQIRRYLAKINPLDKAGGYAIQEEGDSIVKNITGSFTNVVGLPMERLKEEFEHWAARSA